MPGASRTLAAVGVATGAFLLVLAVPALAAEITLTGDGFEPETITVPAGETVVWLNDTGTEHTIVGQDGSWDSGPLAPGDTFSLTLMEEGEYLYGTLEGDLLGTVVVASQDEPAEDDDADGEPALPDTGIPAAFLAALSLVCLTTGTSIIVRTG